MDDWGNRCLVDVNSSVCELEFLLFQQANCGVGNVDGDGVCPLKSGLLPGSQHVILDQVCHESGSDIPWYGSPSIIPFWEEHICHHVSSQIL